MHTTTLYFFSMCIITCTLNFVQTMLRKVEKKVSLGNKIIDIAICGHTVTTPELHASVIRRNGLLGMKLKLKMFKDMIKDTWNNESIVEQAKKFFKSFKLEINHFIRAEHLYREINDNFHNLLQVCDISFYISFHFNLLIVSSVHICICYRKFIAMNF